MNEQKFIANTYEEAIEIFAEAFRQWDSDTSAITFYINSQLYKKMDRSASLMLICGQPVVEDNALNCNEIKITYTPVEPLVPIRKQIQKEPTLLYLVNIKPEHQEKFEDTVIHHGFYGELVNQTSDMFYFELFENRAIIIIPHSWIEFMAPMRRAEDDI